MTELTLDFDTLKGWIGRTAQASDHLDPRTARLLEATLDRPPSLGTGDVLPPLWHWLYFPQEVQSRDLGPDGHARLGGFLPPVALPRRMWAGGRLRFHAPLRLGARIDKHSEITSVDLKTGRSGPLCFVTVRHAYSADATLCLTEEHDIVYRALPGPGEPAPSPPAAPEGSGITRAFMPSMPLLFRYSALTFNSHRIHYDLDHCREAEGYPGAVVHGPLIATLLADLARSTLGRPLVTFRFRATAPVFHTDRLILNAGEATPLPLWATRPDGAQAMEAEAT